MAKLKDMLNEYLEVEKDIDGLKEQIEEKKKEKSEVAQRMIKANNGEKKFQIGDDLISAVERSGLFFLRAGAGRPASPNKKEKKAKTMGTKPLVPGEKRGPGRPPGSTNKPKIEEKPKKKFQLVDEDDD